MNNKLPLDLRNLYSSCNLTTLDHFRDVDTRNHFPSNWKEKEMKFIIFIKKEIESESKKINKNNKSNRKELIPI